MYIIYSCVEKIKSGSFHFWTVCFYCYYQHCTVLVCFSVEFIEFCLPAEYACMRALIMYEQPFHVRAFRYSTYFRLLCKYNSLLFSRVTYSFLLLLTKRRLQFFCLFWLHSQRIQKRVNLSHLFLFNDLMTLFNYRRTHASISYESVEIFQWNERLCGLPGACQSPVAITIFKMWHSRFDMGDYRKLT